MARVASVKRISLDGLSDGWGEESYAVFRAVSPQLLLRLKSVDETMSSDEEITYQAGIISEMFLSGKANVYDTDTNDFVLDDISADDINGSQAVSNAVFAALLGISDPKAIPAAQPSAESTASAGITSESLPQESSTITASQSPAGMPENMPTPATETALAP